MDDNYIDFELNGKKLKINKEDSNDFWILKENKTRKSYWYKPKFSEDKDKYFIMSINGRLFKHHRIVYYAHNQNWDILDSSQNNLIDHKYPNKQNNHISNLRVGDQSLNAQNRKYVKGYTWNKTTNKYKAQIQIDGKNKHLGLYETKEEAHQAYLDAKPIYHEWNV